MFRIRSQEDRLIEHYLREIPYAISTREEQCDDIFFDRLSKWFDIPDDQLDALRTEIQAFRMNLKDCSDLDILEPRFQKEEIGAAKTLLLHFPKRLFKVFETIEREDPPGNEPATRYIVVRLLCAYVLRNELNFDLNDSTPCPPRRNRSRVGKLFARLYWFFIYVLSYCGVHFHASRYKLLRLAMREVCNTPHPALWYTWKRAFVDHAIRPAYE